MATRKPLVVVSGLVQELPALDTFIVPTAAAADASSQVANMAAVQAAVRGVLAKSTIGGAVILDAAECSNPVIVVTGTLIDNCTLLFPQDVAARRLYVIRNQTTGSFSLTVQQASAAPQVVVPQGRSIVLFVTGAGAYDAVTALNSPTLYGTALAPTVATSSNGLEVANTAFVKAAIAAAGAGASGAPSGTVVFHAANSPPTGYLKANGALVSRTTYASLFAAISTTFGAGDGSTTFALPDLRGRFIRSWVDSGTIDVGRAFGSLQDDELKGHGHAASASAATVTGSATFNSRGDNSGGMANVALHSNYSATGSVTATLTTNPHTHTITVAATTGVETRPANIALLACIKF